MALPNTQPPITEADLITVLTQEQYSHLEVVDGVWVGGKESPMTGEEHGAIAMQLATLLNLHVRQHNLGRVYPADLIYVLNGDEDDIRVVRKPDISFVTAERVKTYDRSKPYYQAPDLAIEIVSPSETIETTRAKLNNYLAYGTQQVWVVYPQTK